MSKLVTDIDDIWDMILAAELDMVSGKSSESEPILINEAAESYLELCHFPIERMKGEGIIRVEELMDEDELAMMFAAIDIEDDKDEDLP